MTSTNPSPRIGGYRQEVDHQKLGPALLIASINKGEGVAMGEDFLTAAMSNAPDQGV
jgi:hypothetical protein